MGPITKFNWYDNSAIAEVSTTPEATTFPLFLAAFSADKGTEKMIRIKGDDFFKMYGSSLSFLRHGQALLQAGRIAEQGGELLCKRVVADDALLSNIILAIELTQITRQDRDADTNDPLYIDPATGDVTTQSQSPDGTVNYEPVIISQTKIKWLANKTATNCKTLDEVYTAAEALYSAYDSVTPADYNASLPADEQDNLIQSVKRGTFPLYVVTDIGRNNDCKSIRLVPKYEVSKKIGFMVYTLSEIEGSTVNENVSVTANPNIVYNGTSYAITTHTMGELYIKPVDGMFEEYVTALSDATDIEYSTLVNMDVLFGCNVKGASIDNVAVDTAGIDLAGDYGVALASGSNGTEFDYNGTTQYYKSDAYATALSKFFKGIGTTVEPGDEQIYNRDIHKICACVDANYPVSVKNTITDLADFRQDFFFFRDYTTDINTYSDISVLKEKLTRSRFAADYITTYDVIDKYSQKRINVTMTYSLIDPLVAHFKNAPYQPFAGVINGFTLDDALAETINFIPVTTPEFDQIDLLADLAVNYATYHEYNGDLTVVSTYTSQDIYTQLSYINNVVAIQEVMRALRTFCPKNRYRLQSGRDFSNYKEDCTDMLRNFSAWFHSLRFQYQQDDIEADNKIFHAAIEFSFNNWVESEIFDLYAIPVSDVTD